VGEYELLGPLGAGGMGEIFKARHRRLGKVVALKLLSGRWHGSSDKAARFLREIKALGSLEHPNVVEAHDAGEEDGVVYLAMKLVEGTDLHNLVRQRGPLPVAQACALTRQAALGLQYLHERGLVHRDVKPSNLMLAADGSVKVLDLGLARWRAEAGQAEGLTGTGLPMGTPDYLAPEQARDAAAVDVRADLYALGGTLFYLLTGRPPFGHHSGAYEKLKAHEEEAPPDLRGLRPEVPAALTELVSRLLAKRPADRPQTPAEAAAILNEFAESITLPTGYTPRRRGGPWRALLAAAACALVVLMGLGVKALWHDRSPDPGRGAAEDGATAPTETGGLTPRRSPFVTGGLTPRRSPALRVLRIKVTHTSVQGGKAVRAAVLGDKSFETRQGDRVTVEARLSQPAYAYLISLAPDGTDVVCFPEKEDEAPALTDRPRYPSVSQAVNYGLDEGAGLQVFALAFSSRPLPPYKEWRSQCGKLPWNKEPPAPAGVVWWVHDDEAEALTADPDGQRAKGREVPGKAPVVQLTEWLRKAPLIEDAAAVGFVVLPAEKQAAAPPKPPPPRSLQGEDAKKAKELQDRVNSLQWTGKLEEALQAAQALVELREKAQGAEHYEAAEARWQAEGLRRVLGAGPEARKDYARIFTLLDGVHPLWGQRRYAEWQQRWEKILALRRAVPGEDHPETAEAYRCVAGALDAQGKHAEAEPLFRKALEIRRKALGEGHPSVITFYGHLAGTQFNLGKFADAEMTYRKLVEVQRKVLGEDHADTAESYRVVAACLQAQGKHAEAEPLFRKALEIRRRALGEGDAGLIVFCEQLAYLQLHLGKYAEAEAMFRKLLEIRRKVQGENHPDTVASYGNLITALQRRVAALQAAGKLEEALPAAQALLEVHEKRPGADRYQLADVRWQIEAFRRVLGLGPQACKDFASTQAWRDEAGSLFAQRRYAEAQQLYEKVLAARRRLLGDNHPDTAVSYYNVAGNLYTRGKYAEVEAPMSRALDIRRRTLGEDHPETARTYQHLGGSLHTQGKYAEAEPYFRRALAIRREILGEDDPDTAESYGSLGGCLLNLNKYAESEANFRKVLDYRRKEHREDDAAVAEGYSCVAVTQENQGKVAEAQEGRRKALDVYRKVFGEEHRATAAAYRNLASNLNDQGKYAEAEAVNRQALAIFRKVSGEDDPYTADTWHGLGISLQFQGKYTQAEEAFRRGLAIDTKVHGEDHPDTARSYNNLAMALNGQGRYVEADDGFRKAVDIDRQFLGAGHPSTAIGWRNQAANWNDRASSPGRRRASAGPWPSSGGPTARSTGGRFRPTITWRPACTLRVATPRPRRNGWPRRTALTRPGCARLPPAWTGPASLPGPFRCRPWPRCWRATASRRPPGSASKRAWPEAPGTTCPPACAAPPPSATARANWRPASIGSTAWSNRCSARAKTLRRGRSSARTC
jgi:tetratricopeptide (TPR) repeat protein